MLLDLLNGRSVIKVILKHFKNQILKVLRIQILLLLRGDDLLPLLRFRSQLVGGVRSEVVDGGLTKLVFGYPPFTF